MDQDARIHSFPQIARNAVRRVHATIIVNGMDVTVTRVLTHNAAVIVANHPHDADVLALISCLPDRPDVYLIVNNRFVGLCQNLSKFLIPVYIEHHKVPKTNTAFKRYLTQKPYSMRSLTPEEEHAKNKESIHRASNRLRNGGVIVIFPGRRSIDGHWFSGVGHMVRTAGRHGHIYCMQAHIQGTSNLDYLRFIPLINRLIPPLTVTFAKPVQVTKMWDDNPKTITKKLEDRYRRWVSNLNTR